MLQLDCITGVSYYLGSTVLILVQLCLTMTLLFENLPQYFQQINIQICVNLNEDQLILFLLLGFRWNNNSHVYTCNNRAHKCSTKTFHKCICEYIFTLLVSPTNLGLVELYGSPCQFVVFIICFTLSVIVLMALNYMRFLLQGMIWRL